MSNIFFNINSQKLTFFNQKYNFFCCYLHTVCLTAATAAAVAAFILPALIFMMKIKKRQNVS